MATDLGPWYQALRQPDWKPPDWVFGPGWTLIFSLITLSAAHAWYRARDMADRRRVVVLFATNAVLNLLWSVLFFRMQRPDWALAEVCLLWLSILTMAVMLRRHAGLSSVLLIPYLGWVLGAAMLNLAVVQLNGPFAGR